MNNDLRMELVQTIFQFKHISATGFGMDMTNNNNDINLSELMLMDKISNNALDSSDNVGMLEVRTYLSISKAAVSQMLRNLEKKNYIKRTIDKNNRRFIIVTLTQEGKDVLDIQLIKFNHRLEEIVSHLGEDEVRQMISIVNRMIIITNEIDGKLST